MTVGFTCGAFDLLHPGHVHLLEYSKKYYCDILIVGLHTDPSIDRPDTKNKPIQTSFERYMQLRACKWVNEIIPYDTEEDLYNLLSVIHYDVRILGSDYENKILTGEKLCKNTRYVPRLHKYSSSELRDRIKNDIHS